MKQSLLPLTSLRFFAAAAVVLLHLPQLGPDGGLPYVRFGAAGVTFFFLLSGFILAYTYHDRLVARRPRARREFLVARFARIAPAYLLAFVISLWATEDGRKLLALKFGSALWPAVAHLTLTQALVPNQRWFFGFNPPAWSLSCEWTFYLLFPLLLVGLATGSIRRRLAVFAAASALWAVVVMSYQSSPADPIEHHRTWGWLGYIFPLTRLFDFTCGVVMGILFVHRSPTVGLARGWRYWAWGLAEVGALAALWATLHFCPISPGVRGVQTYHVQMLSWQGYYLPAFVLLVWLGALGRGPLSRVMSWTPLVYLGELSYGVYIFHGPVIWWVASSFPSTGLAFEVHVRTVLGVACGAVLVVSALSYHLWETPMRRWLRGSSRSAANAPGEAVLAFPQPDRRAA